MQIVDSVQPRTQHFLALVQMFEIGAGIIAAGIAGAGFIQRPGIGLILAVADFNDAVTGKQMAVAGVTGRHYAIEHVDTAPDANHQILRSAYPHQITRLVHRHIPVNGVQSRQHFGLGLANRQAADGVTIKTYRSQAVDGFLPQLREHTALHNTEQSRRIALVGAFAALRPA